jgi:hypothetical protein
VWRTVKCHACGFLELSIGRCGGSTLVSGPIALSLKGTTCSYPNAIWCAEPQLSSEVESSSLFPPSLVVTGIRDSVAGGYCVRCLKFAAMVSVEVYEERFSRLKEVDPGKDKVIEASCLDDCSLVRRRILIEIFIYRI